MWTLRQTSQFKKDIKRYRTDIEKMNSLICVLEQLQEFGKVESRYYPHMLKGKYRGFMECHVESDFLLIWIDSANQTIDLIRMGTHSELFKK